jgi:gliding motility-associated-like protein
VKKALAFLIPCFLHGIAAAQNCSTPGQTPVSAIYVCGTDILTYQTHEFCGQTPLPVNCGPGFSYANRNPTFFRFACYSSGTLGFLISPQEVAADLNWQLYDITSTNPVDIFTNPAMSIGGNWSPEPGATGATSDGIDPMVCFSPTAIPFSKMPLIVTGRSYMLMISNESGTTGTYNLHFTGGSATITDPELPEFRDAAVNCDRMSVRLRFNKSMLCQTIANDGSDFSIAGATITAAVPFDCSSVFGTEVVTLFLSQPLAIGNHQVVMRTGSDNNTVLDICNRAVAVDEAVSFVSGALLPTPMDQVLFQPCSPGYIELLFSKKIMCHSLAPDGSDFVITGPQALVPAIGPCSGSANLVRLLLPPGFLPGAYQVRLATGSDGNTIIDECGIETPAGAVLSFTMARGVSAAFTQAGSTSCGATTIQFLHDGAEGVNSWLWDFGSAGNSTQQNPVVNFPEGQFPVRLIVSNGTCSDTAQQSISVSQSLKASFASEPSVCGGDRVIFQNTTTGIADQWHWDFGNGQTSSLKDPLPLQYARMAGDAFYPVILVAWNSSGGCRDTTRRVVQVLSNCSLDVPTAFSPNGDGRNDYFSPVRPLRAREMEFVVYNRWGQITFRSRKWDQRWDGTVNGQPQASGVYVWVFRYRDENGKQVVRRGTVMLVR